MSIEVTSTAFKQGETIPKQYTGDGADQSPPLRWTEPPSGTVNVGRIVRQPVGDRWSVGRKV